jgi:hypothetical protein
MMTTAFAALAPQTAKPRTTRDAKSRFMRMPPKKIIAGGMRHISFQVEHHTKNQCLAQLLRWARR